MIKKILSLLFALLLFCNAAIAVSATEEKNPSENLMPEGSQNGYIGNQQSNFKYKEALSCFGELIRLVYNMPEKGPYDYIYTYDTRLDPDWSGYGMLMMIYVKHDEAAERKYFSLIYSDTEYEIFKELPPGTSDLRVIERTSDKRQIYLRNDLMYLYTQDGSLMSIKWYDGNTAFELVSNYSTSLFRAAKGFAFLDRLLSPAEEGMLAFAELKVRLLWYSIPRILRVVIMAIVPISVSVGSIYIVAKLYKKRNKVSI